MDDIPDIIEQAEAAAWSGVIKLAQDDECRARLAELVRDMPEDRLFAATIALSALKAMDPGCIPGDVGSAPRRPGLAPGAHWVAFFAGFAVGAPAWWYDNHSRGWAPYAGPPGLRGHLATALHDAVAQFYDRFPRKGVETHA